MIHSPDSIIPHLDSFSHEGYSNLSTDRHPPPRDHGQGILIPSSDRRPTIAPVRQLIAPQEPSLDSFFASHRAHRSFRGAIDKLHHHHPSDPSTNAHLDPPSWVQWPVHHHPHDFEPQDALETDRGLGSQPPTMPDPALRNKDLLRSSGPYRTRSLVHCLVNPPDAPPPAPPDPSIHQSFFYDHQLSSSHSVDHPESTSPDHQIGPLSFPDQESSSRLSVDSRLAQTTFSSRRSKDGLPSNSHHLLNSPELKTAHINPPSQDHSKQSSRPIQDGAHIPQGSESYRSVNHSNQSIPPSFKPTRATNYRHPANSTVTPPNTKLNFSPHPGDLEFTQHSHHPPSDDAASILLELSRYELPKHAMSLRRGRGGTSLRSDHQQARASDEKAAIPPTPSGRRYKTRSQINEEATLDNPHNCHNLSPDHPQQSGCQSTVEPPDIDQDARDHASFGLSYGPGLESNPGLIPVSGCSTSVSTCTSRSNTGDGLAHNITPAHDSSFTLYNLVSKPHVNLPGRLHLKLPGCSSSMSMTHSSASTPNVTGGATLVDDDAKSSFSISTQATSLISPPAYVSRRIFPAEVPVDLHFPRLYRTFFVPSAFGDREPIKSQAEAYKIPVMKPPPNSNYNTPAHGYLDLYTPRYVKGVGVEKLGLCCICAEPKDRGGEDTALWLKMKVSSYSYHLSFFHGINNADGLPFSPPVEIRLVKRCHVAANEKLELKEGRCHQCNKWVPMEGVKMQEVKVPELFWWKHAKSCHKSRLAGECNVHIQDEIFDLVMRQQPMTGSLYHGTPSGYLPGCSTPYSFCSSSEMNGSISPFAPRYHPASPAPTCASSVSRSGGSRVHPSVAAQRASAGRVYKRKASNSSLGGGRRRDNSLATDPCDSPQSSTWQPLPLPIGLSTNSTSDSTTSTRSIHQNLVQRPQSPTPNQPNYPPSSISRKTRRSNMTS